LANEKRQKQVARRIQQKIAELLVHGMKDPRTGFITITGVSITSDLTIATVRWSVFEPSQRARTQSLFEHAHGFLRTEVARDLQLRTAPQLVFQFDKGIEHAERIEQILREVLPPKAPAQPEPPSQDA
jgi:ribosome-binding factor A